MGIEHGVNSFLLDYHRMSKKKYLYNQRHVGVKCVCIEVVVSQLHTNQKL